MARLVLHERNVPYTIKIGDQEAHICACGLSSNKPYCDGTHKKTLDEKNETFVYDNDSKTKIVSFYQKN
ncbi:MAG: CDGSH iron-sulfur domain-containing protein [Thermoplasmataceae archaeon]